MKQTLNRFKNESISNESYSGFSNQSKSKTQVVLVIIAIAAILLAAYFFVGYHRIKKLNDGQAGARETESLVKEISKFMILPKEQPTVATVLDKTKLPNNSFFLNSENGDKVLLFNQSQIAILYRPKIHKLISVMPVASGSNVSTNISESGSEAASSSEVTTN